MYAISGNKMDLENVIFLLAEEENNGLNLNLVQNVINELGHPLDIGLEPNRNEAGIVRNQNYFEVIIPNYSLDQFKKHFRMSRNTFESLCTIIAEQVNTDAFIIPLEKKVLFTIWIISKPESFLAASDRFGLGASSGHYIFSEVISILADLMPQYIKWPERHENTCNAFQERSNGFPGVVGAIDGCHIPCKQPIGNPNDFYNRKGFHSIVLQGTCDHEGKFIDVFIGMPGRMHDARIFRNSPIYEKLRDVNNPLLPHNLHLIGDAAYPLLRNVMTPYRNTGHLTAEQIQYNTKLSSIRSIIERAFGCLKGKFRRLKYLDRGDFELGNKIICSACVLHNYIILEEGFEIEEENANEDVIPGENIIEEQADIAAEQKRSAICLNL